MDYKIMIIIGCVLLVILFMLLVMNYLYKRLALPIVRAQAGQIKVGSINNNIPSGSTNIEKTSPLFKYYLNEKKIDISQYYISTADGYCMAPRGIHFGYKVFAKKISSPEEKYNLKKGDILFLRYENADSPDGYGYKLREFVCYVDSKKEEIKTIHYVNTANENNDYVTEIIWSRPHKTEHVLGIVEMFHPQN